MKRAGATDGPPMDCRWDSRLRWGCRLSVIHPGFIRDSMVLLLWLLALSLPQHAAADPATDFEAGNKLFEQGKFAEATKVYETLLTNGPAPAALHFNLGNARFKSGQPGRAVFHYHQALRLTPRDPDIRGNLQFVRRSLGVSAEEYLGRQFLRTLNLDEWAWLAGGGLGIWFLLLGLGEALPSRRASFAWLTKTSGLTGLLFTTLLATAHTERRQAGEAVVAVAESAVRPGPLAESKAAFSLRDGTEVVVLDTKGDWLQVRAGSQRVGWLKRDALLRWE